ncbi:hypothetical protein TPA0910_05590 [Streptomyces hygroscopicus subsp. sporocinereus]|uniref:Uncharacterized protein n=1 Tax=Streptomyces hygroscopicus TaxID=1912 RepID=A0ABQ3TS22_STRHY|nr:hypothetical protein TPA0910_05590 [Streptomyces hygroscopicus]
MGMTRKLADQPCGRLGSSCGSAVRGTLVVPRVRLGRARGPGRPGPPEPGARAGRAGRARGPGARAGRAGRARGPGARAGRAGRAAPGPPDPADGSAPADPPSAGR